MSFYNNVCEKIKKLNLDKKTKIIIVVGFLAILIIVISELDFKKDKETTDNTEYSNEEYCSYLENKVKGFIESIDGAGKTEVIITLAETTEFIYATDDKDVIKNNTNIDDASYEKKYVIVKNNNSNEGLLLKTIEPKIRGIAISCEGGNNTKVQEQIYSSIGALFDISTSNISISKLTNVEE